MPSILFICTANQFRSPVAVALLRERLQQAGLQNWTVESAGSWVTQDSPVSLAIQAALAPLGFDLSMHHPRGVSSCLLARFDLILTMTRGQQEALRIEFPAARGRIFTLTGVASGYPYDVPDPVTDRTATYPQVVAELRALVNQGFDRIVKAASETSR
jgi:protein-tyrosine-phosphatase